MPMDNQERPPIVVEAEEINVLIHAYLVESGFIHSAFIFRNESALDKNPLDKMTFPRSELVELLVKAAQYKEVEAHWKQAPGSCNKPFTLLGPHKCEYNPPQDSALSAALVWRAPTEKQPQENDEDIEDTPMKDVVVAAPERTLESELRLVPDAPDIPKSKQVLLSGHVGEVFILSWNPVYTTLIASGAKDCDARVWNVRNGPERGTNVITKSLAIIEHCRDIPEYQERKADIDCLEWSKDGMFLATGSTDPILRVWRQDTNKIIFETKTHKNTIAVLRFSPNGKLLISSSLDGTVILWDLTTQKPKQIYEHKEDFYCDVAWINDGSFAASWPGPSIHIYMTSSAIPFRIFNGHEDDINAIKVTLDRKLLASVSDDGTGRIWQLESLKMVWADGSIVPAPNTVGGAPGQNCLHVLSGHEGMVHACRWLQADPQDHSDRQLATICADFTCRIWDAATGTCLQKFKDHRATPYGLTTSPDSKYIATAGLDGWVFIYNVKTKSVVYRWMDREPQEGQFQGLYELEWSKDGKRLATGTTTGFVTILDVSDLGVIPPPVTS